MSLKTHSKFYFGFEVSAAAQFIDFDEGSGPLSAVLNIGSYTLTDFVSELARAMSAAGTQTYSVTVNRATRVLTISAPGTFMLLLTSGGHFGTSVAGVAGFVGADTALATSHAGAAAGSAYATQFILQSHVDPADFQDSTYGTVNKSASGKLEVVSYGIESFMACEIRYVNDNNHGAGAPVRYNPTGVDDFRAFMRYLVTKGPLEFMKDEDNADDFISVILESTADDDKGLKFKNKEMYGVGLPGYFESGPLTFRVQ